MMDDHPSRLILEWMGHLAQPQWDEKKAYNACFHCNQRFSYSHQHHCRLCGHMFCSMCTAKYLVTAQFKRKDKGGPDRVCFACRDQCLQRRARFIKNEPPMKPQMLFNFDKSGTMHIYPPVWAMAGAYMNCKLCHEPFSKGMAHHCRVCGEMYDNDCTTKMDVPQLFKKKPKKGPCRVCNECRYHIVAGAILDEQPHPASTADLHPTIEPSAATNRSIVLRWEGDRADKRITTLNVAPHTTLEEIHERLVRAIPAIKMHEFTFISRNKPIFKEHWGVFNAEFLHPEIVLRPGSLEIIEDDTAREDSIRKPVLSSPAQPTPEEIRLQSTSQDNEIGFDKRKGMTPQTPSLSKADSEPSPQRFVNALNLDADRRRVPQLFERQVSAQISRSSIARPDAHESVLGRVRQLQASSSAASSRPGPRPTNINYEQGAHGEKLIKSPETPDSKKEHDILDDTVGKSTHPDPILLVRCKYDFSNDKPTCLSFKADEELIIIKRPAQWWLALNRSKRKGWVPPKYMEVLGELATADADAFLAQPDQIPIK